MRRIVMSVTFSLPCSIKFSMMLNYAPRSVADTFLLGVDSSKRLIDLNAILPHEFQHSDNGLVMLAVFVLKRNLRGIDLVLYQILAFRIAICFVSDFPHCEGKTDQNQCQYGVHHIITILPGNTSANSTWVMFPLPFRVTATVGL